MASRTRPRVAPLERRKPTLADVFDALDFARRELIARGSPDFLRQRVAEDRVQRLIARLLSPSPSVREAAGDSDSRLM